LIDGEAIVCNEADLAAFDLVRQRRHWPSVVLCAFDLLELDGRDLRWLPIEHRKRTLAKTVRGPHPGIVLNAHYEGDGETVFEHACKLGCDGIVSKRLGGRAGAPPRKSRRRSTSLLFFLSQPQWSAVFLRRKDPSYLRRRALPDSCRPGAPNEHAQRDSSTKLGAAGNSGEIAGDEIGPHTASPRGLITVLLMRP
jgi:hypothetical protein